MNEITTNTLMQLAIDLTSSLSSKDRFSRLLDTVRKTIPCDAVALLSFHQDLLKPIAQQGLTKDTLGRRFYISEHPRFEVLCNSSSAVRFSADSPLPDPYDGLLSDREGDLPVHACMGLPLYFNDKLLGLLTIDSLTPHVFDNIPSRTLDAITSIAANTLNTALMIEQLESKAIHNQNVVNELTKEALNRDGGEIIGQSPSITKLKNEIKIVAPSDFNILIYGETGVGKELVARTLHQYSNRSNAPLVYVNCAALPENLIESELFGHVKGAFTGAEKDRAGKFLIADGGTLFLDEIGELPLSAQSKILRAIQNNEIQPVGQDKVEQVDVRIFAATNRNLKTEVDEGRFRADLYHRLSVYPVTVEPLRERDGDLELLTGYFIENSRRKLGISQLKASTAAIDYLASYDWPGNVRELEHVVSRAALKASARQRNNKIVNIEVKDCGNLVSLLKKDLLSTVMSDELSNASEQIAKETISLRDATENFQRGLITKVLQQENGNWAAAARLLSTDRGNLNRTAKRLDIKVLKVIK
ncbi:nitric oxide reductase transcriptional regulator NorR [Thalassomonas sp. M1454]|uniref:nitric oxide reductase transcriptional regulator NorR n=1 Tax=Thalassomonas sp. M1454 TaxID=2594477 RepID=UPI001180ABD6|nr:nitric oxide reductase transcriptional regulator NorR [Thalassomonas sp. M1454]TRX56456.1 nitric oxide reductase transcriptional regulator NorR [Thalassomonas sp. M1454]